MNRFFFLIFFFSVLASDIRLRLHIKKKKNSFEVMSVSANVKTQCSNRVQTMVIITKKKKTICRRVDTRTVRRVI